ncbi:hypothetical protein M011DRAFT_127789 [Sporormia fimetaria CBS 119925]|uniref:Uncharacterized protein n=1 Tax=Sporormia fimetaria CBS 119925 TaxID=1340428 RepID=A0A6A6V5K3_9PLEO|nr:hypothetical protein M011DRAFT_127789 [Sporormia fimetaria CBS 119925]
MVINGLPYNLKYDCRSSVHGMASFVSTEIFSSSLGHCTSAHMSMTCFQLFQYACRLHGEEGINTAFHCTLSAETSTRCSKTQGRSHIASARRWQKVKWTTRSLIPTHSCAGSVFVIGTRGVRTLGSYTTLLVSGRSGRSGWSWWLGDQALARYTAWIQPTIGQHPTPSIQDASRSNRPPRSQLHVSYCLALTTGSRRLGLATSALSGCAINWTDCSTRSTTAIST